MKFFLHFDMVALSFILTIIRPCLVHLKNQKKFKILHHIKYRWKQKLII